MMIPHRPPVLTAKMLASADILSKGRVTVGVGVGWMAEEIAEYLQSGFTPEYDMVGGHMAAVVENTSRLTTADRNAIANYLTNLEN